MSLSRNSEGGIGEAAFLAAASFDAAKLEDRRDNSVRRRPEDVMVTQKGQRSRQPYDDLPQQSEHTLREREREREFA